MRDRDPIGTAARDMRRQKRLGDAPRVCILCRYSDPIALVSVTEEWIAEKGVSRTLLESHHFVGKHHDPQSTVLLCRNCHAAATEGLLREGIPMRKEANQNTCLAFRLLALATFHETTAESLRRWASELQLGERRD